MNSHSHKVPSRRTPKVRTEIRREQIARAALTMIARHGLNELNIGALAEKVGVVPSAIYRHYAGKDEVLDALLDLISSRLLGNVEAVRAGASAPLERLHELLSRHVQLLRDHAGIPRVVFSEQIFAGSRERRRRTHDIIRGYLDEVAGIIREGQQRGQVRRDVSPDTAAVMFLGLVQPAIILWLLSGKTFDVGQYAEDAWRLFRETLEVFGEDHGPAAKFNGERYRKEINIRTTNKTNNEQ